MLPRALEPIAGQWSTVLFASGLVAASLAACVLPGVTPSAICEAFGWERGADRSWDEAPVYRGIITAIIGISAVLVLMPGADLFQIMMTSQVINGVLLPVVLVFQVVIAADRHIMGANRNGRVWNAAHLGDYRRDYGADGRHVCAASDGLQRLTPTFVFNRPQRWAATCFFVCDLLGSALKE